MPATDDTIVAVSSPPGRSARGLVRLAGPDTPRILCDLSTNQATQRAATVRERIPTSDAASASSSTSAPRDLPPPRTFARCELFIDDDASAAALPVLLWHTVAPASYTGDHMAELQCPGHPALLDRLVHRALHLGARLAEPGEFTFRAFLAGKLDLTQAEGISATITASSDSQLQAASLLRAGRLGAFAASLVDELATLLALVEAGIDFVDQDDVVPIGAQELTARLAALSARLDQLLARSRSWGALDALPRIVLAGPPSVGKSTLFNALLGRRRAVVSATAGTTRDVLAEPMTLLDTHGRRVEIMLIDIAGLDDAEAMIDREAQAAARRALASADLLLDVLDSPTPPARTARPDDVPTIAVRTKTDLPAGDDADADTGVLRVSAMTGAGLDALRSAIAAHIGDRGVSVAAEMLALQPRHEAGLHAARAHLRDAMAQLAPQREAHALAHVELIADAMRGALNELAALGGRMTPDDVIGRVFTTFCIGK